MSEFDLEPIRVETAEGRITYSARQREVMQSAEPLRARLSADLGRLRQALAIS
jgi:hypothetical protein